jgi:hypothetical protein
MKMIEARKPESIIEVLALILITPAFLWIFTVSWMFGGCREVRKTYRWMFAER